MIDHQIASVAFRPPEAPRDPIPALTTPVSGTAHAWTVPADTLRMDPSPQRVRVELGGVTVAETARVSLLRGHRLVPEYAFPRDDVQFGLLKEEAGAYAHPVLGRLRRWTVRAPGRVAPAAAWSPVAPPSAVASARDHVFFTWHTMDRWFVEAEEVFGHLKDPWHRVDAVQSARRVDVVLDGVVVAATERPVVVFETGLPVRYYVPREDVKFDALEPSDTATRCAYKGVAAHFAAAAGKHRGRDVAWSYADPAPEVRAVKDLVAFYDERVDEVRVDGVAAPRPVTQWA